MSAETLTPTVNTTWCLEVDTSATETPAYTQVRSLNQLTPPVVAYTTQDATDYDSEGWGSDAITLRKWSCTATALRKTNLAGAYDPGQEALRAAAETGELVHVRLYERRTGGEAYEGSAQVQWTPVGGDPTGLNAATVTLMGQGPRVEITNPTTVTP
ncbi:hypothetical protein CLV28_0713 [Sediminihabitans luteus]|uniref:Phage tail tube protein n=1 Tax=Sediminihabitans luteus TaxID=1138585 RepID=A0A2M9CZX3_9CELL|nr:hypothetical protein [Sediminihabitans luteus]PJJ77494.1 hypothetical protein CLV28_0713 [Sediminihabitans luteus]GII98391.1 hypothetical protein Slu03_07690 [Sediminihabitans luteus]